MLAAVVAAAAVLGDFIEDPADCGIPVYSERWHCNEIECTIPREICCNDDGYYEGNCYTGNEYCRVSHHYQCCGQLPFTIGWIGCVDKSTKTECEEYDSTYIWCPLPAPPAPTAEEPGLSAGATAGIVVGGILGPFALGLAYKTLA